MSIRTNWSPTAILLTLMWFGHSVILVVLEPAMGFNSVADYFDLAKVIPALTSAVWFLSNTLHVALGATLLLFRHELSTPDEGRRAVVADFCLVAAPLFVLVGLSGFVGKLLIDVLASEPGGADAALYGLLAVRFNVLAAAVALLGMMIIALSLRAGYVRLWLRVIGIPIGLAGILFTLVPTPVPVLLFAWSAAFNFGRLR